MIDQTIPAHWVNGSIDPARADCYPVLVNENGALIADMASFEPDLGWFYGPDMINAEVVAYFPVSFGLDALKGVREAFQAGVYGDD